MRDPEVAQPISKSLLMLIGDPGSGVVGVIPKVVSLHIDSRHSGDPGFLEQLIRVTVLGSQLPDFRVIQCR